VTKIHSGGDSKEEKGNAGLRAKKEKEAPARRDLRAKGKKSVVQRGRARVMRRVSNEETATSLRSEDRENRRCVY